MGVISFRVSDEMEIELKKQSKIRGKKLTDLCKEKITYDLEQEELNKVTLENRIEKLENQLEELTFNHTFLSRFIYQFMVFAKDEKYAKNAWDMAKSEIEK